MSFKHLFSRSLGAAPKRLHAAAHSHHLWPDAAFKGHEEAAADAARLADRKWDRVFGEIVPRARAEVAKELHLPDDDSVVFAPNTHAFIVRLQSCFSDRARIRILTTDGEFHSFARQAARWEEAGLADVERVPLDPFETFGERFVRVAREGTFDWVFLSHVFFGSGRIFDHLDVLAASLEERSEWLVIDGYHGFMSIPTDLSARASRIFYLGGGYKYAMSGEGVGFLHAPPAMGLRPVNTGWFAAFDEMETSQTGQVPYGRTAGRFAGATFDPSGLYRFVAVRRMLARENLTTQDASDHASALLTQLRDAVVAGRAGRLQEGELLASKTGRPRARFLAFRHPDAPEWSRRLATMEVMTDVRGHTIRFGLGLYHDPEDVERLIDACASACR